jgi:hypothetical protein
MMDVNIWLLVYIVLTPTGDVETHKIDLFGSLDECMYTVEEIVEQAENPRPWNWEFTCLEYRVNNS